MNVILIYIEKIIKLLADNLLMINLFFGVVVVFFERRNPKSVWAWLLLLYFVPIVGFACYLLLGMDIHKRRKFRIKEVEDSIQEASRRQEYSLKTINAKETMREMKDYMDLVLYNLKSNHAVLTEDNDIDIFTDGNQLFERMIEDMKKAKWFIHIQFYIIKDDVLFDRIREILACKVKQGVEVRILYDAMGCRMASHTFWKKLQEEGMEIAVFFPALLRRVHLRMNYRNHRKIVIVDNEVAYVGGFNIGKEYVDLDERFRHWRDTHLRICGGATMCLQLCFMLDWNYAAGKNLFEQPKYYTEAAYGKRDFCKTQIIVSGPDHTEQVIRDNYLRLIHKAEKEIYIQTPYFIPDEAVFEALRIAIGSGIAVHIMIPCKPDHLFVYWATYSYIGELVMAGADCYTYDNGFLHAKGIIVDGKVLCYGTANMDIRSFALNFEINAVVFDERKAGEMERYFKEDLRYCSKITKDVYASRSPIIRLKEQICRLLSPLL